MLQIEIYEELASWLDNLLENNEMPENTQAFCFNLYEDSEEEHIYSIQLVAAEAFDENDGGDWACEEVWSSEEDIFSIDISDESDTGWANALKLFTELVSTYLEKGTHKNILLGKKGIGIGFVDGELDIIYKGE